MKDFYIYILLCNDCSYYLGHTHDIDVRISGHQQRHYPYSYTALISEYSGRAENGKMLITNLVFGNDYCSARAK